ncbi:hypothetical protein F4802DRAFT_123908 [Xylaria palmicola]|nr:hypothetical protein F4802DRAFT_123908 [Xylaria palmicola]
MNSNGQWALFRTESTAMASLELRPGGSAAGLIGPDVTRKFTIRSGEHAELVTIHASPFQLSGSPKIFHGCKIQASPCCLTSMENEEAFRTISTTCDSLFKTGHWLQITFDRLPASSRCSTDDHGRSWSPPTSPTASQPTCAQNVPNSRSHAHGEQGTQQRQAKRRRLGTVTTRVKRTRLDMGATSTETGSTRLGLEVDSCQVSRQVVDSANEYVSKIKSGLMRIQNSKGPTRSYNIGTELLQCLQDINANDKLEAILNKISNDSGSESWQADFYSRYAAYRRRCLDPAHSETRDPEQERHNKDKEALCQVTSLVVNKLESSWGVCANLIFNALGVTRYKGSRLYHSVSRAERPIVAKLIVQQLSSSIIEFEIDENMPVMNPAIFLGIFTNTSFSEVCKQVGLSNFASMDLQLEIDNVLHGIESLGLYCGQLSLATFLKKESKPGGGRSLERRDRILKIRLGATEAGSDCMETLPVTETSRQNQMGMLLEAVQTASASPVNDRFLLQSYEAHLGGEEWLNWLNLDNCSGSLGNVLCAELGSTISS